MPVKKIKAKKKITKKKPKKCPNKSNSKKITAPEDLTKPQASYLPRHLGRPVIFETVEELQDLIVEYFASCWDYKRDMFGNRIKDKDGKSDIGYVMRQVKPYTIGGMAVFLGIDRKTIVNYSRKDDFFPTIKKAREIIKGFTEEALQVGKNQAGIIFTMKNNYGWVDKQIIEATVGRAVNPKTAGMSDNDVLALAAEKALALARRKAKK